MLCQQPGKAFLKQMNNALTFFTILITGIIAGLFFSWSVSVMPGLRRVSDREFISAMQAMNRAIQNPLFLTCFMGALILLVISCISFYQKPFDKDYYLLLAAATLYFTGVIGITFVGNIPLNNMIENFRIDGATNEAMKKLRLAFEDKWVYLNNLRTAFSIGTFCLLIIRLIR